MRQVCPEKALSVIDGVAVLDASRCDLDGICIPVCPYSAISLDEGEAGGGFRSASIYSPNRNARRTNLRAFLYLLFSQIRNRR